MSEQLLIKHTQKTLKKHLYEINDHILFFYSYGHSNATAIIGNSSFILIDTLDSNEYSQDLLNDLRKYTDKPVKTLIYTHGHPDSLLNKELIQDQVGQFKEAIECILFNTLDCINKGLTLDETVQTVSLPKELKNSPYLQEYYETVEWAVKSVYTGYVGWFDGDPVHLLPVSNQEYNSVLLDLIGEEKLLEKIKDCMSHSQCQIALQLLELIDNKELKKECLLQRAKQVKSANARHYLIAASKEY